MRILEKVLVTLLIVTFVLRIIHVDGSGVLTVLLMSALSLLYTYLAFALLNGLGFREMFKKVNYKTISQYRIFGAVGTGLVLGVALIGILFKLQSYPGAESMLSIATVGMGIVLLISIIKNRKSSDSYYSGILKRIIGFGVIVVFLLVIPNELWLAQQYPNNPEYVKALMNAQSDPQNEELWEIVDEEREKMLDPEKD